MQARPMLAWFAVALWMGVIWLLSDQPELKSNLDQDFLLRKLAHLIEFALLTLLVAHAVPQRRWVPLVPIAWALLYAGIDEWHQTWVLGRTGAMRDVGIDSIGIVLAALLLWIQKNRATRADRRNGTVTATF